MQNIYLDWDELKIIVVKGFRINYKETKKGYELFIQDRDVSFTTNITTPTEISDFEGNFKADANAFVLENININSGDVNVILDEETTGLAKDSTLQQVRDTIGEESGQTVLSKLDRVDNTLNELLSPFPGLSVRRFVTNESSPDLNINGSTTPVEFIVKPTVGKIFYIHTISILIQDTSINFQKFGGISTLTNGVDFKLKENGLSEIQLANIKKNSEFYIFANEIILDSATIDILVAHIRIKETSGTTFKLKSSTNDYFKIIINDNLTNINKFTTLAQGYEVNE